MKKAILFSKVSRQQSFFLNLRCFNSNVKHIKLDSIVHKPKSNSNKGMLVGLHGVFGSGRNWNQLGQKWCDNSGFEVHLLTARNHGESAKSNEMSFESMVADTVHYIETNKQSNEKIFILGHSLGGKTAMLLSLLYPKLIDKLIVVDIAPINYSVREMNQIFLRNYIILSLLCRTFRCTSILYKQ